MENAVEGVVITVLLIAGTLCILAQAYVSLRATKPRTVETTTSTPAAPASAPAARSSRSKTAAAPAPEPEADAEDAPNAAKRLGNSMVKVLQEQSSESSTLGFLGMILLLIAVALVVDISFAFSIST